METLLAGPQLVPSQSPNPGSDQRADLLSAASVVTSEAARRATSGLLGLQGTQADKIIRREQPQPLSALAVADLNANYQPHQHQQPNHLLNHHHHHHHHQTHDTPRAPSPSASFSEEALAAGQRLDRLDQEQADFVSRLGQYVDLSLVRKVIAQNMAEIIVVCVILIYLVYYFSQISKVSCILNTCQLISCNVI